MIISTFKDVKFRKNMPVSFYYIQRSLLITLISCLFQNYLFSQTYVQPKVANQLINSSIKKLIFDKIEILPEKTQLSIAVIKNDSVYYLGYIKKNNKFILKNNIDSIFEIGSISKVFTSTLLAHALTEKKVKKDQSINKYLPFKIENGKNINLVMLSNHTSGFPRQPGNWIFQTNYDPLDPYKNYTSELLTDYLKNEIELTFEPGSNQSYSNLGAGVLGYILSEVYKNNYEELLQEKIFNPLNMENSTSFKNNVLLNIVNGRDTSGNIVPNWEFNILSPCGGILSSVKDMTKFILANLDENEVFNLQKEITYRDERNLQAMGWICAEINNNLIHWHNGATGGYSSFISIDKKNKNGLIILSNIQITLKKQTITQIGFEIMKDLSN